VVFDISSPPCQNWILVAARGRTAPGQDRTLSLEQRAALGFCLSRSELKAPTAIANPRGNPSSLGGRAATVATRIGSTAVLEFGPTEIFRRGGVYQGVLRVSVDEAAHPRPRYLRKVPASPESLGGFRRETDCLLEGNGFENSVPRSRTVRGTESLQTPRWRKADSNCWSHLERDQPFRAVFQVFSVRDGEAVASEKGAIFRPVYARNGIFRGPISSRIEVDPANETGG
jgi:hypothetical protein